VAAAECLDVRLETEIPVIGMDTIGPPAAHFLFRRAPTEFQPCPIHEIAHGVGPRGPDGKRRAIGHLPELFVFRTLQSFDLRFQLGDPMIESCYFLDLMSRSHLKSNLKSR
jgi:hypothetical protein